MSSVKNEIIQSFFVFCFLTIVWCVACYIQRQYIANEWMNNRKDFKQKQNPSKILAYVRIFFSSIVCIFRRFAGLLNGTQLISKAAKKKQTRWNTRWSENRWEMISFSIVAFLSSFFVLKRQCHPLCSSEISTVISNVLFEGFRNESVHFLLLIFFLWHVFAPSVGR